MSFCAARLAWRGCVAHPGGRHDFERDAVFSQFLEQRGEVPQVPRQPVEPVDDHLLDAAGARHLQQSQECWPLQCRARVPLVVKAFLDALEAQGEQRMDPRLAGFELHLAGREIVMRLYRLASVDGAANRRSGWRRV